MATEMSRSGIEPFSIYVSRTTLAQMAFFSVGSAPNAAKIPKQHFGRIFSRSSV
jgi:hypothetical protein